MESFAKCFINQFFRINFQPILFWNKVQTIYFQMIPNSFLKNDFSFLKNDFVKRNKQINAQNKIRSNFSKSQRKNLIFFKTLHNNIQNRSANF